MFILNNVLSLLHSVWERDVLVLWPSPFCYISLIFYIPFPYMFVQVNLYKLFLILTLSWQSNVFFYFIDNEAQISNIPKV